MEITFNIDLEDLSKRILERKSTETKTVWEMHQEKIEEKRKARKRSSKDDHDYSDEDSADENDDFFENEKADGEVKPIKKQKVKGKGKLKDKKLPEEHFEPGATKEELELLVAADQDAANGAEGCNIKRRSKKGKGCVEDKLPEIDISHVDGSSVCIGSYRSPVQEECHLHEKTLDSEPPLEESPPGNPDDASSKKTNRKHDVASSTELLQMLSAVNSLKRNLTGFQKASKSDR